MRFYKGHEVSAHSDVVLRTDHDDAMNALAAELAAAQTSRVALANGVIEAEAWIRKLEAALRRLRRWAILNIAITPSNQADLPEWQATIQDVNAVLGITPETPIASRGECLRCGGYFPAAGGTVGPHECLGAETVVKPKPKPDWHGSQSGDGYSCYTCGAFTLRLDDIASVEKDCTKCDSTNDRGTKL